MADLMEYVNVLADQIGPRPVSTEEEHQASLFVAQELSDDGLDVSVDEFATPSGVRWPYVIAFAASALGTVISGIGIFVPGISLSMFILGLLLVAAGLFIYFTEYNNQPFLSKMRANGVSQNVVAKYVPESVARETRRRKKIIIAAHVDTVRAQPEASPKLIAHAPLLHKIIFYCMIGLVGVLFIRLLPLPWPEVIDTILWAISIIACVYILAAAACIVASRFTPYISGGNDNASSIAVLLSVAHLMTNPAERERFTKERTRSTGFVELEEADGEYDEYADAFTPELDDVEEPIMHSLEEAYDEGLVPEGVQITYDDDGAREDATVAFPALTPEEQLDVLADAAAEELHFDSMSTGAFSLDDVEFGGEEAYEAPTNPGAISEMKVPDLDVELDEEIDPSQKKPVERIDDSIIFAEYMGADDQGETEEVEVEDEVIELTDEPELQLEDEVEVEAASVEPVEPAPIYKPIQPHARKEKSPQVARPVPSWYAAAKEKAAKDLQKRAAHEEQEDSSVFSYRSRFADAPAAREQAEVIELEREGKDDAAERIEAAVEAAELAVEADIVDEQVAEAKEQEAEAEEAAIEAEVEVVEDGAEAIVVEEELASDAPEAEEQEPIEIEILDDQLDELSPDASGLFTPVQEPKAADAAEKSSGVRTELPSRIPNIGSSDDRIREERKIAHESMAARGRRTELESIPDVDANPDIVVDGDGLEVLESTGSSKAVEVVEVAEVAEPVVPATQRVQRKKPTARHVTQQFVPTRATSDRDIQLGENRQEAPVSATYEGTEQAAPAADPFAPKDEASVVERVPRSTERSARSSVRQRTEFSASYSQTIETHVSPANTSAFPALTGSFPAVRDNIPTVDAGDFATTSQNGSVIADDAALDSFMAASHTTEINIPESRFRNAVDKVGGLFNRKNKDAEDYEGDSSDAWSDEDDYGWKGGGYFEEETESAFDAVRQRAAQIRESVVSMTEHDLLDKEVWFVALGASGAGAQGMKNFIDLHSSELRGALIINLEAVGAGTLSYIDVEGTGKPHRADRRLMSLVKRASKELKGVEMKPKSMEWRDTDATPAMIAGLRALTIMGISGNGVAPVDWHTAEDTAAIVEEDKLEYMTKLLLKVIENS